MTYEEALAWVQEREAALDQAAAAGDPLARVVTYRLTGVRVGILSGVVKDRLVDAVAAYVLCRPERGQK